MPFNLSLIAQNEYGLTAWMSIVGIEILNEGGGLSVDDITNEEQMTYVAKSKTAWVPWIGNNGNEMTDATGNFYTGLGSTTASESSVFPFPSGDTLNEYVNWMGMSGETST